MRRKSSWALILAVALAVVAGCATARDQYHRLSLIEKPKGQVATVLIQKKTPIDMNRDVPERAKGLDRFFEAIATIPEALAKLVSFGFVTDTAQVISGDISEAYQNVETWQVSVEAEEDVFDIAVNVNETADGIVPDVHVQRVSDALNAQEPEPAE